VGAISPLKIQQRRLRRRERAAQLFRREVELLGARDRQRDLALALEKPASVEDRHADEISAVVEAEVMTFGSRVEVDSGRSISVMEIKKVAFGVVADLVASDAGDLDAHGSRRRADVVTIRPRSSSQGTTAAPSASPRMT
jgi:hypothetical protein